MMYEGRVMYAADIESTGLIDDLLRQENPKLHNLGRIDLNNNEEVLLEGKQEDEVQAFLDTAPVLIMHSGITYDAVALEILGYDVSKVKVIDTLALSYYLEPKRRRHGLAEYGEEFGIPKPVIEDWNNQTQEEYNFRVMQDCRIQKMLWQKQLRHLRLIYGNNPKQIEDFIDYIMFKMKMQKVQQDLRWKFDKEGATTLLSTLEEAYNEKFQALFNVMPKVPVYATKTRPNKPYKKNGELSVAGADWEKLCKENGFQSDHDKPIVITKKHKEPNPNSNVQLKDWLYALGWWPTTFKFSRNKETNEEKKVPQIYVGDGELCDSIKKLIKKEPGIEFLGGLGVIKHRMSLVKGMLRDEVDGYLTARYQGLTNTLRLKHSELVNLPSTRVAYGKEIRGLLIAEDGYQVMGSDLSSLEDRCKHHFQVPYDPEYVKTQMADDYDPHLLICEIAGLLTKEQVQAHKDGKADFSDIRHMGKGTNYSCQYGAGGKTVARAAGVSEQKGNELKDAYWELNWSIEKIAESTNVKTVDGQMWQENPINGFWYSLRTNKDRFSTLCQGSGAYIFDMWVMEIFKICEKRFKRLPNLIGQFHDELILLVKDSEKSREGWRKIMDQAMSNLNEKLGLNREMASDTQFGNNYAQIH